ncbi:hypothetical protein ACFLWE_01480, partial [Chloroflexota bacterium]
PVPSPIPTSTPGDTATESTVTSYWAETAMTHGSDGNAYVGGKIVRFFDSTTGETVAPIEGIGAFDVNMTYYTAGVSMKAATGFEPFSSPTVGLNVAGGTKTTMVAFQTGSEPQPSIELFRFYPWLIGTKDNAYTINLHFNTITLNSTLEVPIAADVTRTFRRGDANNSGGVNVTDALVIAQYLVGLRYGHLTPQRPRTIPTPLVPALAFPMHFISPRCWRN